MRSSKGRSLAVIVALTLALLARVGWDIFEDWQLENKPLWSTVAENSISIFLCVAIVAIGIWLYQNRNPRYLRQSARWQLAGGVAVFFFVWWVVEFQQFQGEFKPALIPFQSAIGGVLGGAVVGYATAETEQTRARAERERDRLEALLSNAPSEIAEVRYTGTGFDVLRTNDRFDETFVVDGAETEQLSALIEHDPATVAEIEHCVEAGEVLETETTLDTPEGAKTFQLRVTPLGEGIAYLIYSDVTDIKETQHELEQSVARLERSNARLEEFAYIASHDLQEPLRTVSRYVEIIEADYGDALGETGQEFVETVVTATGRMQSMINGLLDYSRVTTRGGKFEAVETAAVVEEVVDDLELLCREEGGSIEIDSLPTVEADRDQLWQVFQNLVKNALEHSADDEPVTITISGEQTAEGCRFVVEDDGPGIDEYLEDDLFDMFESGENYQTEERARGIGLAVVERIVDRHEGDIWVESERGEGSRFVFTIPQA